MPFSGLQLSELAALCPSVALATPELAVPKVEPTHVLIVPRAKGLELGEFSPDGSEICGGVYSFTIDLGRLVTEQWPAEIGILLGLATLLVAVIFLRMLRRRQARGEPHCRRCNYNVLGQTAVAGAWRTRAPLPAGTLCPECGIDLSVRRPVRGRSVARRMLVPALLLVLFAGAYATRLAMREPPAINLRPAGYVPRFWSDALWDVAERHQIRWLMKYGDARWSLARIDAARGRVAATIQTDGREPITPKWSRDGKHVAFGVRRRGISWVRVDDGKLEASASFEELGVPYHMDLGFDVRVLGVAEMDPGGSWVFVMSRSPGGACTVTAWCPQTKQHERVLAIEPPPRPKADDPWGADDEPGAAPDGLSGIFDGNTELMYRFALTAVNAETEVLAWRPRQFRDDLWLTEWRRLPAAPIGDGAWVPQRTAPPRPKDYATIDLATPAGKIVYSAGRHVLLLDLATGAETIVGDIPSARNAARLPEIYDQGRAILNYSTDLQLYDLRRQATVAHLVGAGPAHSLLASGDGKRLAAYMATNKGWGPCSVRIYMLPEGDAGKE